MGERLGGVGQGGAPILVLKVGVPWGYSGNVISIWWFQLLMPISEPQAAVLRGLVWENSYLL